MTTEYARLNEKINRLEIEVQELRKDVNELEETKQTSTELKIQYKNIETMLQEVRTDVKNLQAKPTKYWDNIIIALTAGGIGFIISKLFGV